ncbi:MAG: BON domain-containing protein [Glycocaulis sp.]
MEPEGRDLAIRWEILEVFELDVGLARATLGVGVSDGVVTLTGIVDCGAQWTVAESLARRVNGVRDVIMQLQVAPTAYRLEQDRHLAARARGVLNWFLPGEISGLQVDAAAGWVTLTGKVFHYHVKEYATHLVRRLEGVAGVDNRLLVLGGVDPRRIDDKFADAFQWGAEARQRKPSRETLPGARLAAAFARSPAESRNRAVMM